MYVWHERFHDSALLNLVDADTSLRRDGASHFVSWFNPDHDSDITLLPTLVPHLIWALGDNDVEVRRHVDQVLYMIGEALTDNPYRDALSRVFPRWTDSTMEPKRYEYPMKTAHTKSEVRAFATSVGSDDLDAVVIGTLTLAQTLPCSLRPSISVLSGLLADDRCSVQQWAAGLLRRLGSLLSDVDCAMSEVVAGRCNQSRLWAIRILGSLGSAGRRGVPVLIDALAETDWTIQEAVLVALAQIRPPDGLVANTVSSFLGSPSARLRALSAYALGHIAFASTQIIDRLISVVDDPILLVRRCAVAALVLPLMELE